MAESPQAAVERTPAVCRITKTAPSAGPRPTPAAAEVIGTNRQAEVTPATAKTAAASIAAAGSAPPAAAAAAPAADADTPAPVAAATEAAAPAAAPVPGLGSSSALRISSCTQSRSSRSVTLAPAVEAAEAARRQAGVSRSSSSGSGRSSSGSGGSRKLTVADVLREAIKEKKRNERLKAQLKAMEGLSGGAQELFVCRASAAGRLPVCCQPLAPGPSLTLPRSQHQQPVCGGPHTCLWDAFAVC